MLLKEIDSPEKLKKLTIPQLEQLSKEIRDFLIENLSQTGGHLAPNLRGCRAYTCFALRL